MTFHSKGTADNVWTFTDRVSDSRTEGSSACVSKNKSGEKKCCHTTSVVARRSQHSEPSPQHSIMSPLQKHAAGKQIAAGWETPHKFCCLAESTVGRGPLFSFDFRRWTTAAASAEETGHICHFKKTASPPEHRRAHVCWKCLSTP